jgi:hypothetical protein
VPADLCDLVDLNRSECFCYLWHTQKHIQKIEMQWYTLEQVGAIVLPSSLVKIEKSTSLETN